MNGRFHRTLWIDYLRSAITVLVIAHHSALAYTTFASFNNEAYILSTHPVVDIQRWGGLDVFVNYNDIFFMSLMFFIGGLFIIKSIAKKGVTVFLKDRFYRLFVPFIIGGTLLMLLAYFPAFYVAHHSTDLIYYIKDFFLTESWPVGPPWFIWVLFVFNLVFATGYRLVKKRYNKRDRNLGNPQQDVAVQPRRESNISNPARNPNIVHTRYSTLKICLTLLAITWLLYVPVAMSIGAYKWTGFGPFDFQVTRVLLYFGYFVMGAIIGSIDFNTTIFALDSPLIKSWQLMAVLSLSVFIVLTLATPALVKAADEKKISKLASLLIYYSIYVLSCTLTCIAFITTFKSSINRGFRFWNSLTENAYLIYLVHFVFVTWIQFLLLNLHMTAFTKFGITFTGAFALSWISAIFLRKIAVINRFI